MSLAITSCMKIEVSSPWLTVTQTIRSFRWRAEVNQHLGVRSELVDRKTIKELVPHLRMDEDARFPIMAGLWHADGATARHDAVVWGYAKGACERGIELHQLTEVQGFEFDADRVVKVKTNRGDIRCGCVVQAVAGMSSVVAEMAGIKLPIHSYPLTGHGYPAIQAHVRAPCQFSALARLHTSNI